MTRILTNKTFLDAIIDVLVGGTPCQSFSTAGLRGGLADQRGNLALQYCRILIAKRPKWFVWENVPGVFSSFSNETDGKVVGGTGPGNERIVTETADFATLLNAFRECGYSCAWRVLDAQFFGVPQRRRRVFVVGYLGNDWRPPAAVLFDAKGSGGNITAGSQKRKDIAGTLTSGTKGRSPGVDEAAVNHLIPWPADIAGTLTENFAVKCGIDNQHIKQGAPFFVPLAYGGNNQSGAINVSTAINAHPTGRRDFGTETFVVYPLNQISSPVNRSNPKFNDPTPSLTKSGNLLLVPGVRRITPLECERLQGFPDNYTNIPGATDTPRYKSLGNSMAVPVMKWLGKRIQHVTNELKILADIGQP